MFRRDLLRFFGGAAAGAMLTPVPWKLLSDGAIWTQTRDGIPKLPRGEVTMRAAVCVLCPAGCLARARCVAGRPFLLAPASLDRSAAVAAAAGGAAAAGALCPLGLSAHHLSGHPRRLRAPFAPRRGRSASRNEILAEVAGRLRQGSVALLDGRPGRAISDFYRGLLARVPGGAYVPAIPAEERTLHAVRTLLDAPPAELGLDLERADLILSFGAELLEGWGGPSISGRTAIRRAAEGGRPALLEAEARASVTALRADRWLPIRPGSEAALALAIGRRLPAERAAAITGLRESEILEAAEIFARSGRSLAIGGGDPGGGPLPAMAEEAIAVLNLQAGAAAPGGPIRPRRSLPAPLSLGGEALAPAVSLGSLAERSVRLLIVDAAAWSEALPWDRVERALAPDALVVSFSPYLVGHAARADYVLPAPAALEGIEEAPTPPGAPHASLAISQPLLSAPRGCTDPVEFLRAAASKAGFSLPGRGDQSALIDERLAALVETRAGVVAGASGERSALSSFASPGDLRAALMGGSLWIDEPLEWSSPPSFRIPEIGALDPAGSPPGLPLVLVAHGLAGLCGEGAVAPVLSKLYRESGLREPVSTIRIHPETASISGVRDGAAAVVETTEGIVEGRVQTDGLVLPGVVQVAAGPDPGQLGEPGAPCPVIGRRGIPARIREA